ncbi:long-chain fatty acid--CoA ligase [Demequina sp. NBRC 110053]|uniref:AMP-dependent synthetase/ligase n=1 Tax=Demequina sp. NBRC 110053 TaxID=1570342 RepID=UPI001F3FEF94|nr:AMP-dependent synthetase/ligase [Demequina sp. NBRC 110053]
MSVTVLTANGDTMGTPGIDYPPSIIALVSEAWSTHADRVVMRYPDADDEWVDVTGAQAQQHVNDVAKGLIALGVAAGDRVAILSRTRYEWTVLDFAIMSAGAIPVPIYDTSSESQIDWITSDAEVKLVVAETTAHAARTRAAAADEESPIETVLTIDDGALDDLIAQGREVTDDALAARIASLGHDSLATIMYTSGTTGRPKGVRLTHFSYVRHIAGIQDTMGAVLFEEGASTVLFLTLAHSLARLVEIALVASGMVIGFCPDPSKLVPAMQSFHPTLVLAVPRVFEKVYNSAEQKAAAGGKVRIFRWAAKQAIDYSKALDAGGPSIALKVRHAVADRLVLSKIREVLGGKAHWAISGSAPLGDRLGHFYRGLGLTVLEGYGLTETNAASHVNVPELAKIGTVGPPLPGIEVSIAEDGEILMRGEQLFEGYHRNPDATAESIADGWFHTGDIGAEDEDGYLTITGRKKELIVTAGGKNVAPAELEDGIRSYVLVSQCVVVGDAQPFIAALVTLDAEALPGWLKAKGMEPMTVAQAAQDERILASLQKAIDRANTAVSKAESVRTFRILEDDLTVDNGMLTPSLKVKRGRVLEQYAEVIDEIYAAKHSHS